MKPILFSLSFSFIVLHFVLADWDVNISPGFPYGIQKVRGVNLGGWLVLEPWITPSLFNKTNDPRIIDEWTFGQYQDRDVASRALAHHWETWVTEGDFAAIANAGLNHVRVPIGYWAYDISGGEPFIQGQLLYLERAIVWAEQHGLKVIVDLHGAPGSQNGFDNSGQKMDYPTWHTKQSNIDRTDAIIKRIAAEYKDRSSVVTTIAPLNEPAGYKSDDIVTVAKKYWKDSYSGIRGQGSDALELIHDAFKGPGFWKGFMPPPQFNGVMLDTHIYQMFSDAENARSDDDHITVACGQASSLRDSDIWVVVGEWTPAATDCALWLNGRFVGSRYDGSYAGSGGVGSCYGKTGRASTFSDSYKKFLRKYWEAQVHTYEAAAQGWIQWTWKVENADEWSYQAGLVNGWIPQDPTSRMYPNVCG